jgi:HlyD family secretion protein
MRKGTKIAWIIAAAVVIAGLVFAFRPKPILVETAMVKRAPLQETLDEEGKTRMHARFVLAAPVAGKLRRIELHAGDTVRTGQIVGKIDPAPIEPRQTAILEARLEAARAAKREAEALASRARAEHDQAISDLDRGKRLFEQGVSSKESLEKLSSVATSTGEQLNAVKYRAQTAAHAVEEATAALIEHETDAQRPVSLASPVDGRVLRLFEESERVVSPGASIVEIGYTPRLEIVADFLTQDAVRISAGMEAIIDDWGGEKPLRARVRTVEPGAFTKISALGVEEQRVNVILDFAEASSNLADAYRVEVRVITWEGEDVIQVPSSAVFRSGANWAVFKVLGGTAHQTIIKVGHRGSYDFEVVNGLSASDSVIVHPSSEVKDGSYLEIRPAARR